MLYVAGGSVLTSAGKAAALDLCRAAGPRRPPLGDRRSLVVPPHHAGAERLDQPLLIVADLARRVNMSSRRLGRQFRSATGTTPLQWLLTQRIRWVS